MAGYHLSEIPRGILGQYSKVMEEFIEFADAVNQDCKIMAIVELSDLLGAMKLYFYSNNQQHLWDTTVSSILTKDKSYLHVDYNDLEEIFRITSVVNDVTHWEKMSMFLMEVSQYINQYNLDVRDLIRMNYITERAFKSGERISA